MFAPDNTNGSGWSPWELAYPWSPELEDRRERLDEAEGGLGGIAVSGLVVCLSILALGVQGPWLLECTSWSQNQIHGWEKTIWSSDASKETPIPV